MAAQELVPTKFYLYSTAARYYLVGRSKDGQWMVLTLVRAPGCQAAASAIQQPGSEQLMAQPQLEAHETASSLTQEECGALLRQIHAGNAATGGLQLVCKVRLARAWGSARMARSGINRQHCVRHADT